MNTPSTPAPNCKRGATNETQQAVLEQGNNNHESTERECAHVLPVNKRVPAQDVSKIQCGERLTYSNSCALLRTLRPIGASISSAMLCKREFEVKNQRPTTAVAHIQWVAWHCNKRCAMLRSPPVHLCVRIPVAGASLVMLFVKMTSRFFCELGQMHQKMRFEGNKGKCLCSTAAEPQCAPTGEGERDQHRQQLCNTALQQQQKHFSRRSRPKP